MKLKDYKRKFDEWMVDGCYLDYGYNINDSITTLFETWVSANYGNSTTAAWLREERDHFIG